MNRNRRDLPLTPDTRLQHPTGNAAVCGEVNQDGQGFATGVTIEGAMDGNGAHLAGISEGLGGVAGREGDSHNHKVTKFVSGVKSQSHKVCKIAKNVMLAHPCLMDMPPITPTPDPWTQRAFFLGLLDAKVEQLSSGHMAKGVPAEDAKRLAFMEIARELGLKSIAGLEHSYRYDKARQPKRQVMEKAALYFDAQLWQIYGPKPVAVKKDELALAKDALSGAMGADVLAKLSDEQILAAYRVAMTTAKAMLAQ